MLQIAKGVRTIVLVAASLALFWISYILLGWGPTRSGYYGLGAVVLGAPIYFASLLIAIRLKMQWLCALVASLRVILGVIVLFVCAVTFVDDPHGRWFPVSVLLILASYCVGFAVFVKMRANQISPTMLNGESGSAPDDKARLR